MSVPGDQMPFLASKTIGHADRIPVHMKLKQNNPFQTQQNKQNPLDKVLKCILSESDLGLVLEQ